MGSDEAKKQYIIFSIILALIVSFILNFFFAGILEGPYISGFPFSVTDLSGIEALFKKSLNTVFLGAFLIVPVYYGLMWLQSKR